MARLADGNGAPVRHAGAAPPLPQRSLAGRSACTEVDQGVDRGIVSWIDILETWRPTARCLHEDPDRGMIRLINHHLPADGVLAQEKSTRRADALADRLRAGMNELLARRQVAGLVYGESSVFHVFLEPPDATTRVARREDYTWLDAATLKGMAPHLVPGARSRLPSPRG
jgi:hypothetical protein